MEQPKPYDLIVVGSGPGGYVAAIRAAQLGLKTAIVEREKLGGICLNWGCIPSKALLTNARVFQKIRAAQEWGIQLDNLRFDIDHIIGRSRTVAEEISKGVAFLMKKNKIDVVPGTARFRNPHEIQVLNGEGKMQARLGAPHIVVATGARARQLPQVEVDGERILTYRHALVLRRIPRSIIILGGGAIGAEFAYFYNSFGSRVTVVEMMKQLLPQEDEEVGAELARSFKKQGMEILLGWKVTRAGTSSKGVEVEIENEQGERRSLQGELALNAVGVVGNVENLGLEEMGVEVTGDRIPVDQWYRTNIKGIYAIGDVVGPPWLAHVASHEGIVCVEKLAGRDPHPVAYHSIPYCTYCQPQVASLGLSEKKARAQGLEIKVGKFPFRALGKARASQATEGFVKLIFEARYGELIGAHIIGEEATELISELVSARGMEATYLELFRSVHPHPTLSEAVMEAAGAAFGEAIHL